MAAPAHYLADQAESNANRYTDQKFKELLERIQQLEKELNDAKPCD